MVSLSKLLVRYERTRGADSRDKVDAMLGLTSDHDTKLNFVADHNKDIKELLYDVLHFCELEDRMQFVDSLWRTLKTLSDTIVAPWHSMSFNCANESTKQTGSGEEGFEYFDDYE